MVPECLRENEPDQMLAPFKDENETTFKMATTFTALPRVPGQSEVLHIFYSIEWSSSSDSEKLTGQR